MNWLIIQIDARQANQVSQRYLNDLHPECSRSSKEVGRCYCTVFSTGRSNKRPKTGKLRRLLKTVGKNSLKSNQNPYVSSNIPTTAHPYKTTKTPDRKKPEPCKQHCKHVRRLNCEDTMHCYVILLFLKDQSCQFSSRVSFLSKTYICLPYIGSKNHLTVRLL